MPVLGRGVRALLAAPTLASLTDWLAGSDTERRVDGVAPEEQDRFRCDAEPCTFSCRTALREEALPMSVVNDDFCDCLDGSDEPGTAACAGLDGTLFHCRNTDGLPRLLYASRIRDGICDCCDGSDEKVGGSSPCSNTCQEEKIERERLLENLQKGLEKHKENRREAKNTRQRWREEVESLKKQLPQLQQDLERAKAAQSAVPAPVAAQLAAIEAQVRQLQAEVAALKAGQEELRLENAVLQALVTSRSAAAADGAPGAPSPPDAKALPLEPREAAQPPEPEAVVSEYAKWMEKADEVLAVESTTSTTTTTSAAAPAAEEVSAPSVVLSEAEREAALKLNQTEIAAKVSTLKARLAELEGKLSFLPEEKLAYFALMDTCLESEAFNGHTYSICFFRSASQAGGTQGNVSLGTYAGWKGPQQIRFTGGRRCGTVERSLTVKFRCAEETKILEVSEPGHCAYEATVLTAGACGSQQRAEVKREAPRLRHPREEEL